MNRILLFEEFKEQTLIKNIEVYNKFLSIYKGYRSSSVAWEADNSQIKNFELVSNHIKSGDSLLDFGCGMGDFILHLDNQNIQLSDYLGVDINKNYISIAKDTYKNYDFKLIKDANEINKKFDIVCAIGVFTWYIDKDEFIETINKLHDLCNKKVLLTFLYGKNVKIDDYYWESEYRVYNEQMFYDLFPHLNLKFEIINNDTMLVIITK